MEEGTPVIIRSTRRPAVFVDYRLCQNGARVAVVEYRDHGPNLVPPQDLLPFEKSTSPWTPSPAISSAFIAGTIVVHKWAGEVGTVVRDAGDGIYVIELIDGEVREVPSIDLMPYLPSGEGIDPAIVFWPNNMNQKEPDEQEKLRVRLLERRLEGKP